MNADAGAHASRQEDGVDEVEVAVQAGDAAPGRVGMADLGLPKIE
jgi:hypothetical protein